jgi:peptide/nickel transport system permease protein
MAAYIFRRLLWTLVLLFIISGLVFIIFSVLPSADPAALRAGRQATPEGIESVREQLGLDKPLIQQYLDYMEGVFLHLDFGRSYVNDADVRDQLLDRLPATLFLVLGAAILWLLVGLTVGIISAIRRGSFLDRFAMTTALVAISAPPFWLGLVLLYLFAEDIGRFQLFPGSGAYQTAETFPDKFFAMILPWMTLAAAFAAIYARLLRANLIETMGEDYIRTARAKGLRERKVVMRHGVRSAITPIVTILGLDIGILMGGAILTESVFNIPGIGRLAFDAIERNDLMTIQGTVLLLALAVCIMNLIVDILYSFLDPRVRLT